MGLFSKKKKAQIDESNLPNHIGFIMDGNGRWAKKRGLPRSLGHREGANALKRVCEACRKLNIKTVSVYALSTENLQRDEDEVNAIFKLIAEFFGTELENAIKNEVKITIIGNVNHPRVPADVKELLLEAEEKTKDFTKYYLNIAFIYGGRDEIVRACNKIIAEKKTEITEEEFSKYLYTAGQPDPDLIVRSSGEQRISNFLIWQMAYSEFYFEKTHWPDFNEEIVKKCIIEYQTRNRRFGKV